MCLSYLKLCRGLRCNKFRHLCSILQSLCLVVSYFACLSLLLCHFSCRTFRWCFQGEENNAEEISPANLLACYDNAQSRILGLRHRSLFTDGLHWVRSLLQPYWSRLFLLFTHGAQSLILWLVFGSLTGFSWPAEAMGSCWSCLYRDPIRDNHLTKFKVCNSQFDRPRWTTCVISMHHVPSHSYELNFLCIYFFNWHIFFLVAGHQCGWWGQWAGLWDHGAHSDRAHSSHTKEGRHPVAVPLPPALRLRLEPIFIWEWPPLSDWAG